MTLAVVDTSALAKLLVEEDESDVLRRHLADASAAGDLFAISSLAVVELRRLAIRLDVPLDAVQPVVAPFTVLRLAEGVLQLAGHLPHRSLRTLDAMHVATALVVEAGALLTYDDRQGAAAAAEGLTVVRPG